jgi:hypothetical protein
MVKSDILPGSVSLLAASFFCSVERNMISAQRDTIPNPPTQCQHPKSVAKTAAAF